MSLSPKPELENLKPCDHGGLIYAELKAMGFAPEEILDFSVCSNPFMLPSEINEVISKVVVNRYPDSETTELRQCLSAKLGVAPDEILAGNGATELIRLIALTYFGHGDRVLILEPTFGEYEIACQIVGAKIIKQRARAEESFVPRIEETVNLIRQHQPKGVFICNPNNPTGQYLTRQEIETILDACTDGLLILDEAYIAFTDESWPSIDLIRQGNVITVRSMTKDYGLAGLRLGYAISSQQIIDSLHKICPPWNVNAMAQKAGVIMLGKDDYLDQCKQEIQKAKQFLTSELHRIGFESVPSRSNYFLVKVTSARGFRTALLKHGIMVRDCTSFGLPEYVRIAPRTMSECQKLIATIEALKGKGELDAKTEC